MERNDFIGQIGGADSPNNKGNKKGNNKGDNKGEKKVMATAFNIVPSLFNTVVKILPFGLYLASIMESILFNDLRGFFVFLGLLINDVMNIGYNYLTEKEDNERCAVVRNMYSEDYFVLPTGHTEYMSFITSFLLGSMFFKRIFNYGTFIVFVVLLVITIYMRISIGCEDFIDSGYSLLLGAFKGFVYYIIIKDYYEPEDLTPEDHWLEESLKKYFPVDDADDEFFE
jgi:hypothetical protein